MEVSELLAADTFTYCVDHTYIHASGAQPHIANHGRMVINLSTLTNNLLFRYIKVPCENLDLSRVKYFTHRVFSIIYWKHISIASFVSYDIRISSDKKFCSFKSILVH